MCNKFFFQKSCNLGDNVGGGEIGGGGEMEEPDRPQMI